MLNTNEVVSRIKTTCTFFDQIVDCNKKDKITEEFINDYREFVLDSIARNRNLNMVKRYDVVLGEYITNIEFFNIVQKRLAPYFKEGGECECIVINLYEELDFCYQNYTQKDISNEEGKTRWI